MGPPKIPSELVPAQGRFAQVVFVREEVVGVQLIVAEKFKERSVKFIRARACRHVQNATAGAAVLG